MGFAGVPLGSGDHAGDGLRLNGIQTVSPEDRPDSLGEGFARKCGTVGHDIEPRLHVRIPDKMCQLRGNHLFRLQKLLLHTLCILFYEKAIT